MYIWLQWLRGPVFWAALTFMIIGLVRHVAITAWDMRRAVRRAGDKSIPSRQVIQATLRWLLPVDQLGNRLLFSLTSLVFHVSIILVPIFLAGHITLWQRSIGLSWPALPNWLATTLTIAAVITAVALIVQRLASRDSRVLSRFQDYALPLAVALPFASGLLVMHPTWNPLPHDVTMLLHVLSADALLFLIPITKLNHMALLPSTQLVSELAWHFPSDAGSRVGAALGKANEPI
jgi:nitrate reductase gamma subunit